MAANHPGGSGLAVAPRAAIDREILLPRRSLSIGASGKGDGERRYKLVANIDRGGMGELFLAELHEPRQHARYVVIKRLLADLLDDEKYIAMFVAEADVMSKLNHPNIVRVFDTPIIDGTQCLAMEYVRGRNVQQILARCEETRVRMPPQVVLRIMVQVLRGLDYAHNFKLADGTPLNLVHRDVTPGNVLVSFDGETKLTDFGIAKSQMSAVSTTVGIVKGKARYLAPEQILGEQATPRSDIFSSAGVIVEMLTGKPVFDQGSVPKTLYAIVNGERADLEQALGFRAPLLVQLLNRALNTDPRHRLQTAKELAEGLDAAARLIGKPLDNAGAGAYLRDLYHDIEDPLSAFDPAMLMHDPPTVHAYRSDEVSPSELDSLTGEEPRATVRAPSPRAQPVVDPAGDGDGAERTVQAAAISPSAALASPAGVAGTPDLPAFVAPRGPIHDPDTAPGVAAAGPEEPSAEALAAAALSAYSGVREPPTHVIRGTPLAPPGPASSSVDEALSVLAWLQSRRAEGEAPKLEAPPAATPLPILNVGDGPKRPETSAPDRPRTELRPRSHYVPVGATAFTPSRTPLAIAFVAGAVAGMLLTLVLQAVVSWAAGDSEPPAVESPLAAATAELTEDDEDPYELEPLPDEEELPAEALEAAEPDDSPREVVAGAPAMIDLTEPRGARIRLDGVWLDKRIPFRGVTLPPGRHQLRIQKGKWKHDLAFSIEAGERLDLTRRLKRRAK